MKDVLAFLRILVNPRDNLSWNRILLQLDKVGPKTAQKITGFISAAADPFQALPDYPAGKTWKGSFKKLVELIRDLLSGNQVPSALYERVLGYYMPVFYELYADDHPKRQKDLDQLSAIMKEYDDLQAFIDDTTLDPPENTGMDDNTRRLILSTIHSSKGLEFDAVFVIGLAEGRFPHSSAGFGGQWEEERRLLYVAATRARKYLYLTYPRQLMGHDRRFSYASMSPFLAELGGGLYQKIDSSSYTADYNSYHSGGEFPAKKKIVRKTARKLKMSDFSVGCQVKHPFFGTGTVKKLSEAKSLDVFFDRHGLKTLHLDYAKLKIE
jgi:DNA helicase-2/ATP-dependent DNA helicase PcrA